jgi:beta-RFAP synthase
MKRAGLRIRTPSRLHFGLLGWGPQLKRQFGGLGLMIEAPGVEVVVERAESWMVDGPLAPRVEQIVGRVRSRALEAGMALTPAHIRVEKSAEEHVGLGVGTQLCLAVARALLELAGVGEATVEQLAQLTGRGDRSGIGLYGFHRGGLIVDGGRASATEIPPLLARVPFPEDWSILIVQPTGDRGLHGPGESRAFGNLPPMAQDVTDSLCRLVLMDILPAVIERDLPTFGSALGELQRRVGSCFAPAQGGIYAGAQSAVIIDELQRLGCTGAGQSSWGPTLYAFAELTAHEFSRISQRLCDRFGLRESAMFRTRADNWGARFCAGASTVGWDPNL